MHDSSQPIVAVISVERPVEIAPSKLVGIEAVRLKILWPVMVVDVRSQIHGQLLINEVVIKGLVLYCVNRNCMDNSVYQVVIEVFGVFVAN